MNDDAIRLTDAQRQVTEFSGGVLLVYGPAGSGKTEVLVQRTRRLLGDLGTGSSKILALTFSRQAAEEMRKRILDVEGARDRVVIETTHAWALSVLRSHGRLVGVPADPRIYATKEDRRAALALALSGTLTLDGVNEIARQELDELLDAMSRHRRLAATGEDTSEAWFGRELTELLDVYEQFLRENDALDYDLMLGLAIRLLEEHPKAADLYRGVYPYIHVDEAQDLVPSQWRLLEALLGARPENVVLLADPAQSIYGFRGADPEALEEFASKYQAKRLDLSANMRCSAEVLRVSYPLLDIRSFDLHADNEGRPAGQVDYREYATSLEEAAGVADWIGAILQDGLDPAVTGGDGRLAVEPDEVAVLGRNRSHLAALIDELERRNVDYQLMLGERSLFDTEEFGLLMRALNLLAHPKDQALRTALLASVGLSSSSSSDVTEVLRLATAKTQGFVSDALTELLRSRDRLDDAIEAVEAIEIGEDQADSELLNADRDFFVARARRHCNRVVKNDWSWSGVLRELTESPRPEDPGIRVSTVHGAKGREFRVVVLVGMNEGMFPDFREAGSRRGEASERRLAYVAVTRAQYSVLITRPRVIDTRRGPWERPPSRFLELVGLV